MSVDQTPRITIPKVVVFIPPPVDPGEAPININIIYVNSVGAVNAPIAIVLNPAVSVETL